MMGFPNMGKIGGVKMRETAYFLLGLAVADAATALLKTPPAECLYSAGIFAAMAVIAGLVHLSTRK
jgi:hypothetical protein